MTQRERHAPDTKPRTSRASGRSSPAGGDATLWEELFHRVPPNQRRELLALAARQGVLHASPLPVPASAAADAARRPLLPALLNGHTKEIEPITPPALDGSVAHLDPLQRQAIARALHTPDICLIQGLPGTGKSRVVAEVLLRAASRGERVLLLAPGTSALDRVLEQLSPRDTVCPVRCLEREEPLGALSPDIRRLTFAERERSFREQTLHGARQACDAARKRHDSRASRASIWPTLEEIAQAREAVTDRQRQLEGRPAPAESVAVEAAQLADVSADRASPYQQALTAALHDRDGAVAQADGRLAALAAELRGTQGELAAREADLAQLCQVAQSKQNNRWWMGAFWRGAPLGDEAAKREEIQTRLAELQTTQSRLEQETLEVTAERDQARKKGEAEDLRLREEEIARRQADRDRETELLNREGETLGARWKEAVAKLGETAPADETLEKISAARATWQAHLNKDAAELEEARQWMARLEAALPTLPARLARCANVVASTLGGLSSDPHFGDRAMPPATFDLLVLEEAEQVTESEFLTVARRARRWVLVGEPRDDPETAAARRPPPGGKPLRPAALRPGFFQRLWQHLHADPRRLPYSWVQRDGRLICRLRPILPDQEQWVESEPLADRTDIELRIVTPPRGEPLLVEVIFPATVPIDEAKGYLFRELEELPVQSDGPALWWDETSDEVLLRLAPCGDPVAVVLEPGVTERVGPVGLTTEQAEAGRVTWQTCALAFAREQGWTRSRAEEWVTKHLRLRDLGRTAVLTLPHRFPPRLANFLSTLLFEGGYRTDGWPAPRNCEGTVRCASPDEPAPVTFVPVPTLEDGTEGLRQPEMEGHPQPGSVATAVPRLRAVKGGAGLEVDLAEPRPQDSLPSDLRAVLPQQGLVNYPEAQAMVRALEALAADPTFLVEAEKWCQRSRGWTPAVAVLALYPAQAHLLARLLERVPALAASRLRYEIGLPVDFRHRECLLALVSLTRSHTHRAVTYGEGPHALAEALTRSCGRVVIFGDPGTLARRSQWSGPLDHLDEVAAGRERALAAELVEYLQGAGAEPEAFCLQSVVAERGL